MIKNFLDDDSDRSSNREAEPPAPASRPPEPTVITLFDSVEDPPRSDEKPYIMSSSPSESAAETLRRTGMAWSLGIAFFSAVVFMLILGWGADLLFGSSPWGVVIGLVVGSLIGFYQLFRMSSQIFKS